MSRYRKGPRVQRDPISSQINDKLTSSMPDYSDLAVSGISVNDFVENLNNTQKRALGELLRRYKFSINTINDVKTILTDGVDFIFEDTDLLNFNKFVNAINRQAIPKEGALGPKESVSITKYDKAQVDAWIDKWVTDNAGQEFQTLDPIAAKAIRKAVTDYAATGSVTKVEKDAKGRTISTYTPGVSEAGIQETIEKTAKQYLGPQIERNQAFEFAGILNKTLGIGSI